MPHGVQVTTGEADRAGAARLLFLLPILPLLLPPSPPATWPLLGRISALLWLIRLILGSGHELKRAVWAANVLIQGGDSSSSLLHVDQSDKGLVWASKTDIGDMYLLTVNGSILLFGFWSFIISRSPK